MNNEIRDQFLERLDNLMAHCVFLEAINIKLPRGTIICREQNEDNIDTFYFKNNIDPNATIEFQYMDEKFLFNICLSGRKSFVTGSIDKTGSERTTCNLVKDEIIMSPSDLFDIIESIMKLYQPWEVSIASKCGREK